MCDLNRNLFLSECPNIEKAIKNADFVAIDTEFTGLKLHDGVKSSLFDSGADRYRKLKPGINKFAAVQIEGGVSAGESDGLSDDEDGCTLRDETHQDVGPDGDYHMDEDTDDELWDDLTLSWSKDVDNSKVNMEKFEVEAGPDHHLEVGSSPIDYVKLLVTDDDMETFRVNTNDYARMKQEERKVTDKRWTPIVTIDELWAFFAIIIIIGINVLPQLRLYWSAHPAFGNTFIKNIMQRDRFMKLLQYFHVSDARNEPARDSPTYTKLCKLLPFYDNLKEKFQTHMKPFKELSVDEALVKTKGRSGIVQYMPLKPAKRGIKFWLLATSFLGYVWNLEMYCGRKDNVPRSGAGLGYDVIVSLVRPLFGKWYHVFFDRFFSCVSIMIRLLINGVYVCGTALTNRKMFPVEMKNLKLPKHSSQSVQCTQHPNLLCTVWHDKKSIAVLSTNSIDEDTQVRRRTGGVAEMVNSPVNIRLYNQFMGGVDVADQRRKYYHMGRKSVRWWYYSFYFLFDTAIHNAFILYTLTNMPLPKNPLTWLNFRVKVAEDMAVGYSSRKKRGRASSSFEPPINAENVALHKKVKLDVLRICVHCARGKVTTPSGRGVRSSWECSFCEVCLCGNCFGPWHDTNLKNQHAP